MAPVTADLALRGLTVEVVATAGALSARSRLAAHRYVVLPGQGKRDRAARRRSGFGGGAGVNSPELVGSNPRTWEEEELRHRYGGDSPSAGGMAWAYP